MAGRPAQALRRVPSWARMLGVAAASRARTLGVATASWVRMFGVDAATWAKHERDWLPSAEDRAFVASLMGRVAEPGRFANWIAPPARGINNQPVEFEYVKIA